MMTRQLQDRACLDPSLHLSDILPMSLTSSNDPYGGSDRRSNPRLRELVDEMLASIRAASNVDLWTNDERARYQADMARIMESVREHAIDRSRMPGSGRD